ncbi:hypothetical protein Dacet_2877 [Denitrovibrio acetiphilus DSM 12809]|uniref:Uncharacterized protein n=2 Tax=Denitrovibrio TaxID=117999 RepID=D4H6F3_DENA2|nr:hypothetical protein Dacet_2877 [Denitrovibrio acetiphilus DSM 12809]
MTGCAEQFQIEKQEPVRLFNREYYAVKNLTRSDIRKMKEMMQSDDISAAKTAGLILGRHYVRSGDVEQGFRMIKENLDDSYLDRFTRVSGHLWLYDAGYKMNDIDVIDKEGEYLQSIEMDPVAQKVFRHYCAQEKRAVIDGDLKGCALSDNIAGESPVEIEIFEEPKHVDESSVKEPDGNLMEKIVLNVKSAEEDPKLIDAMLYTISKLGVDVELDFTGVRDDYDFSLDVGSKILTSDTTMYEFAIEMDKVFEEAANLAMLNGGTTIVLGYTKELYQKALEIEDKFKNSDVKIYMFDIEDPNFQTTLSTIKEKAGKDTTISFAVGGSQEQLAKVVPFLRYYSDKPDKTVIACAVDGFGKVFFSSEYAEYFRGAYVVTEVLLLSKANVEQFNQEYYDDYAKLPAVKDMLGHDIVVFMERLKNPSFIADYLTGIKNMDEGTMDRDTEAYKIVTTRKIRKLVN